MNQSFAKFLLALRNTKNDHFKPEFLVMILKVMALRALAVGLVILSSHYLDFCQS